MCTEYVRRHIMRLPSTKIFTTRELLPYGKRGSVDQALSRMVNAHFIIRLARGVFVKDASLDPSQEEIVKAKMTAWNKVLYTHAENLLISMNLIPLNLESKSKFAINAHSSSFNTVAGRVELQGIGWRRIQLCATLAGRATFALWYLKEKGCTKAHVSQATQNFYRTDREDFRLATVMMPAWLGDLCRFRFPSPRVTI